MRTFRSVTLIAVACFQVGCGSDDGGHNSPPTQEEPTVDYPTTRQGSVVETHFDQQIADPYRWLENSSVQDAEVAGWISSQRQVTSAYLATLPERSAFRSTLARTFDFERVKGIQKAASRYFFTKRDSTREQPALYVRDGATGAERLLLDPAAWSNGEPAAIGTWRASHDGGYVAYGRQDDGSDWRTIRVVEAATGRELADELKWARLTQIAWTKDGSGFFYSRYPTPADGAGKRQLSGHAIYFHRLGTAQDQDALFFSTPDQPGTIHSMGLTTDGRYGIIYSTGDLANGAVSVVDLESPDRTPRKLISGQTQRWSVIDSVGSRLFLMTSEGAERAKIVSTDLAAGAATFTDVVPEQEAILTGGYIAGDRLLATYRADVNAQVRRYRLDGTPDGTIRLPGIGDIREVSAIGGDNEAFFVFASFNTPDTAYRYDVATDTSDVWIDPKMKADLSAIVTKQVFYRSKDGTRVPMFVVRRRDLTGPAPTLLTAYGAFAESMPAAYSSTLTAWILQGGVLAIANVRGGGEYGAPWYAAGRGLQKQNTFDDFVAAAEYLQDERVAPARGITAYGDSAGGLLVGAVVNQRPDLFGAALPSVGVMDMLRFDRFGGGALWAGEYGDPKVEADFKNLLSYSPLHNVGNAARYPAVLVTTGENDTRVVPGHSYKYTATLQAAQRGPRPRLIRIDANAGHGVGKPTAQAIEEAADMWSFAAHWTGLQVEDPR